MRVLLREGEPVGRLELAVDVEAELFQHAIAEREDRMVGRTIVESGGQPLAQGLRDGVPLPGLIVIPQEQQDACFAVVIGGHLVVEAQDLRAASKQRRTVRKGGKARVESRPDRFLVEAPAQLQARDERRQRATPQDRTTVSATTGLPP